MAHTIPLLKADLGEDGIHLLLNIKINGTEGIAVLDTGASRSAFDEQFIIIAAGETCFRETDKVSTGLGSNSIKCRFAEISELSVGDLLLKKYLIASLDLSHINLAYEEAGLDKIAGIIGNDILLSYKAVIDYEKLIVSLSLL
jgi:hypothetical protein